MDLYRPAKHNASTSFCNCYAVFRFVFLTWSLDVLRIKVIILQAAEETGRKLKVYAVEKNPNAVITLHVSWFLILDGYHVLLSLDASYYWIVIVIKGN